VSVSRRKFLKNVSIASSGLLLAPNLINNHANAAIPQKLAKSTVHFTTGTDRKKMMNDILTPLKETIKTGIVGKQIIIKPNCVWKDTILCATHADAIRGLITFLRTITDAKIIIAESTVATDVGTLGLFKAYGYDPIKTEFSNIEFKDLNQDTYELVDGFKNPNNQTQKLKVIKTFLNQNNYIISICRPKTHTHCVVTGTIKNMLMGAPLCVNHPSDNEKTKMHGNDTTVGTSERVVRNMLNMANHVKPSLAIIEGVEGMEGNGPVGGTAIQHGIALAGTDGYAVDVIMAKLMGVDTRYLLSLKWPCDAGLGNFDESNIEVIGPSLTNYTKTYKLHNDYLKEIEWIKTSVHENKSTFLPPPLLHVQGSISRTSQSVSIFCSLVGTANLTVSILNLKGQTVRQIFSNRLDNGRHLIRWDGRDSQGNLVKNGTFIVSVKSDNSANVQRTIQVIR
jgi:uncharacterized protein (DUF362 family)